MSREDPQFKLRMPEDLRDRLAAAAQANGRSMNAEILARLSASLTNTPEILTTDERLSAQRTLDKLEEVRNDAAQEIEEFRGWLRELKEILPSLGPVLVSAGDSTRDATKRIAAVVDGRVKANPGAASESKPAKTKLDKWAKPKVRPEPPQNPKPKKSK